MLLLANLLYRSADCFHYSFRRPTRMLLYNPPVHMILCHQTKIQIRSCIVAFHTVHTTSQFRNHRKHLSFDQLQLLIVKSPQIMLAVYNWINCCSFRMCIQTSPVPEHHKYNLLHLGFPYFDRIKSPVLNQLNHCNQRM